MLPFMAGSPMTWLLSHRCPRKIATHFSARCSCLQRIYANCREDYYIYYVGLRFIVPAVRRPRQPRPPSENRLTDRRAGQRARSPEAQNTLYAFHLKSRSGMILT
jgi:hypothetical protein